MRKSLLRGIAVAFFFVVGCVMPPQLTEPLRISEKFNQGYDRVWQEAVRMVAREGYVITATDKSSGLISYTIRLAGEKVQSYSAEASDPTPYRRGAAIIQILIESGNPDATTVTVFSRLSGTYYNFWTSREETRELMSKGDLEKELFTKLGTALGERKFEFMQSSPDK